VRACASEAEAEAEAEAEMSRLRFGATRGGEGRGYVWTRWQQQLRAYGVPRRSSRRRGPWLLSPFVSSSAPKKYLMMC